MAGGSGGRVEAFCLFVESEGVFGVGYLTSAGPRRIAGRLELEGAHAWFRPDGPDQAGARGVPLSLVDGVVLLPRIRDASGREDGPGVAVLTPTGMLALIGPEAGPLADDVASRVNGLRALADPSVPPLRPRRGPVRLSDPAADRALRLVLRDAPGPWTAAAEAAEAGAEPIDDGPIVGPADPVRAERAGEARIRTADASGALVPIVADADGEATTIPAIARLHGDRLVVRPDTTGRRGPAVVGTIDLAALRSVSLRSGVASDVVVVRAPDALVELRCRDARGFAAAIAAAATEARRAADPAAPPVEVEAVDAPSRGIVGATRRALGRARRRPSR